MTSETTSAPLSRTRLAIEGMHCAACVTRLEKVLGKQAGALSASVNLATETALIEHDASWRLDDSIAAVRKAGFEAYQAGTSVPASTQAPTNVPTNAPTIESGSKQGSDTATEGIPDTSARGAAIASTAPPSPRARTDRSGLRVALSMAAAVFLMLPMLTGQAEWSAALQFLVATPVLFIGGAVFLKGAWGALRNREANMDVLVSLGSLTAWAWSLWIWLGGSSAAGQGDMSHGHLFFEASASVIAFVLLGKWLEKKTRDRTASAITGLARLRPDTVERIRGRVQGDGQASPDASAPVETLPLENVRVGDYLRVPPAARIACDGSVVWGHSHIDESALTGEPVPVSRRSGDTVRAGTLNLDGVLIMEVTTIGEATLLGQVVRLIEEAQGQKLPVQALVDRIAAVFVPLVLLLSLATGLFLLASGHGFETALLRTVTMIVVACPCALGLATPAAIIAGTGAAARAGLLIREPRALDSARLIDTLIFDKTGTLTVGRPVLETTRLPGLRLSAEQALRHAAGLQTSGSHPLGVALQEALRQQSLQPLVPTDLQMLAGIGVQARLGESIWMLCHARHAQGLLSDTDARQLDETLSEAATQGQTVSVLLTSGVAGPPLGVVTTSGTRSLSPPQTALGPWQLMAVFTFNDALRPEASNVLTALKSAGLRLIVLSGDRAEAVAALQERLPLDEAHGACTPADKARFVQTLKSAGRHVALIGDGVNDAPAMALADLAIAMGSGTDIAAQTAHITLMGNRLEGVAAAIDIGRRIHRNIAENLFWAFAYNVICIPLAAIGWFGPSMAAAAMSLSSVSVVTNALRLTRWTMPKPSTH